MRYFVTGEQNRQLLINTLILMFLAYVLLLCLSNALMFFHKMQLSPDSVLAYYLGSEQAFTQPRSYQSLLEVSHFHLFAMGMLVLTLTHLMLMTEMPTLVKVWLSVIVYGSAIADEAAGWLICYVHPLFAYFKILSFVLFEISLIALVLIVLHSLLKARSRMRDLSTS